MSAPWVCVWEPNLPSSPLDSPTTPSTRLACPVRSGSAIEPLERSLPTLEASKLSSPITRRSNKRGERKFGPSHTLSITSNARKASPITHGRHQTNPCLLLFEARIRTREATKPTETTGTSIPVYKTAKENQIAKSDPKKRISPQQTYLGKNHHLLGSEF